MIGTQSTVYRTREKAFLNFFSREPNLVYCSDINGLMNELKPNVYKYVEWRLFIDFSQRSLKVVLIHNINKFASIPLAHSIILKESYVNVEKVLSVIEYSDHNWMICGDLKIVTILLGQQSGFTKHSCFLCLWDSRDRKNHYKKQKWPEGNSFKPGSKNILQKPLVYPTKILLPLLHIKLGFMKQFVKSLNREGDCFRYLENKFPSISDAKLKEGIFDGPQIRKLLNDDKFTDSMNDREKAAWISFKEVVENFLGNFKSDNYKKIVKNILQKFQEQGCLMSIKLHFLHFHLEHFPENLLVITAGNKENVSTKISKKWSDIIRDDGMNTWWQIFAGCWRGMLQVKAKKERWNHSVGRLTMKEQGKDEQTNIMEFFVG